MSQTDALALSPAILAGIPALYAQRAVPQAHTQLYVRFYAPDSLWVWYVAEAGTLPRSDDLLFFGYVCGTHQEWGYFTLAELAHAEGPHGARIAWDAAFRPCAFGTLPDVRCPR